MRQSRENNQTKDVYNIKGFKVYSFQLLAVSVTIFKSVRRRAWHFPNRSMMWAWHFPDRAKMWVWDAPS